MSLFKKYATYISLEKGLSANTNDAYLRDVKKLLSFLEDIDINPIDATLEHLHQFTWALHELGISARSIARIHSAIRSFYHFLLLEDYIAADPTELLDSPKIGSHLPEVLTVEEIDAIENAIDLSTDIGHRDRAFIEMLYSCGLRVSELCNLRMNDLFLDEGFIRVIKGKGNKERLVPISLRAERELNNWFSQRNSIIPKPGEEDYVFLSPLRRKHLSRITIFHNIRQHAAAAGITKNISPHTFRHSFATHLLEGGANLHAIQLMLGHESIKTTEVYTHIDRTFLRKQILEYFPRNQNDA